MVHGDQQYDCIAVLSRKLKVKLSRYTPWRRLRGEKV
jgi:hypothetical protein